MPRANFQVLILPYREKDNTIEYCLFQRADTKIWQGISGGGEDDESPVQAAVRETFEEANIIAKDNLIKLQTTGSIPCYHFRSSKNWGAETFVITEYSFGIKIDDEEIKISKEHLDFKWLRYEEALKCLSYDTNRTALWELKNRITGKYPWES